MSRFALLFTLQLYTVGQKGSYYNIADNHAKCGAIDKILSLADSTVNWQ